MMRIVCIIILAEILTAAGQVFYKKGVNAIAAHTFRDMRSIGRFLSAIAAAPFIWAGVATTVCAFVFWILALAQADLSFVYPLGSIQYIFAMVAAHLFLNEPIDRMKLTGTLLVMAGVILISASF